MVTAPRCFSILVSEGLMFMRANGLAILRTILKQKTMLNAVVFLQIFALMLPLTAQAGDEPALPSKVDTATAVRGAEQTRPDGLTTPERILGPIDELVKAASTGDLADALQSAARDPAVQAQISAAESIAAELERSEEGVYPKAIPDTFRLTGQKVIVYKNGKIAEEYDASTLNFEIPALIAQNFDRDVKPEIDSGTGVLTLVLRRGEEIVARHIFPGVRPVRNGIPGKEFARDRELLTVLEADGTISTIDMGYAFLQAFRSPVPVVTNATLKVPSSYLNDGVRLAFISRGLKPYQDAPEGLEVMRPDAAATDWVKAGDFVVTDANDRLLGIYDRGVMQTQIHIAESVIALLAVSTSPDLEAAALLNSVIGLQEAESVRSQSLTQARTMNREVREALTGIPSQAVTGLIARAGLNKSGAERPRDQMYLTEWQQSFSEAQREADRQLRDERNRDKLSVNERAQIYEASEEGDFGPNWQRLKKLSMSFENKTDQKFFEAKAKLLYRFMTSKAMKTLATVAAGAGGVLLADASFNGGQGLAWAMMLTGELFAKMTVLADPAYRMTLLKSSLALLTFVPIVWWVGTLVVKSKGVAWAAKKGMALVSFRFYATLILPFFHQVAKIAGQPNFILALREGLNPLQKITPESDLGKKLNLTETMGVGTLDFPASGTWKDIMVDKQKRGIAELAKEKERVRSLAWTMALIAVSEKSQVDPATLGLAARMSAENVTELMGKLASDPKTRDEWFKVAQELYFKLNSMKASGVEDVSQIDPIELARYYELATKTAEEIKSRTRVGRVVAWGRNTFNKMRTTTMSKVANFGVEEYKFLMAAEPGDFVAGQFWKQFVTDYSLAVVQMALIGGRANMADPQALAAKPGGFLWTNPGHFADMADQVRIYGLNVPARMALVYQKAEGIEEHRYDPIDGLVLKEASDKEGFWLAGESAENHEGFWRGMWEWTKGAHNLKKANYGNIWIKTLARQLKTIQVGFLMVMFSRMVLAHREFVDSVYAFTYMMIWSNWQFGWYWEPVTRGNQIYGERIEEQAGKFNKSKSELGMALRLDDTENIRRGYQSLLDLYRDSKTGFPPEMEAQISNPEVLMESLKTLDKAQLGRATGETAVAIMALRSALSSGNVDRISEARQGLASLYSQSGTSETSPRDLLRLNAASLLEYSLRHPPFATSAHPAVEWVTTMMGAVLTTYLATSMSVEVFRENISWPEKIGWVSLWSTLIYTGVYFGQKLVNKVEWGKSLKAVGRGCKDLISGMGNESNGFNQGDKFIGGL